MRGLRQVLLFKEAADIFGYQLNSRQMKESAGKASRSLSIGEYQYLLLLANMHPSYRLVKIILPYLQMQV